MQAGGVVFQKLLDGGIQYRVPLFQRTYSWEEENWDFLWDNLLEIYDLDEPRSHFLGAIVTLPIPDAPEYCSKFMLIDGQQRLTTLFIILSVIRDAAKEDTSTEHLASQIEEQCLINKFATRREEQIKLRPTQKDEGELKKIIEGNDPDPSTRIGLAHQFYRKILNKGDLEGEPIDLAKLKTRITNYLDLVSITLGQDDSPHRIFESLNNAGMVLTASDLVRNHIFMQITSEEEQNSAYNSYWLPMQRRMEQNGELSALSGFFWRYLMKDGETLRYDEIYDSMKKHIEKETKNKDILEVLGELDQYSEYYIKFWQPDPNETSETIREQFNRLNQWEVDVAYPFFLSALHKRNRDYLNNEQLLEILKMVESYVVRRIICGIPTNRLRRVFGRMAIQVDDSNYVDSCRMYLMDNDWPTDKIFHQMFQTARVYIPSRRSRTHLILSSLEQSYEHHEPIEMTNQITIEHIMPQTLSDDWHQELGEDAEPIQEKYLHTIGNITYSGYNSEMGNSTFSEKKEILSQSHFELNRQIIDSVRWTEIEIESRARELADRALSIWKREG
jgi:uncharacterized protein with ParB-like and HNH nuclease domain